jgi:hypothetical protein
MARWPNVVPPAEAVAVPSGPRPLSRLPKPVASSWVGLTKLAEARERGAATNKALADAYAANVLSVIREIRRAGETSLHQIANALNARGIATPKAGSGYAKSVSNVLARA